MELNWVVGFTKYDHCDVDGFIIDAHDVNHCVIQDHVSYFLCDSLFDPRVDVIMNS